MENPPALKRKRRISPSPVFQGYLSFRRWTISVLLLLVVSQVESFAPQSFVPRPSIPHSSSFKAQNLSTLRPRSTILVKATAKNEKDGDAPVIQVVSQRWVQLAYLSALALLSDWICFSVAATPGVYEESFHHSASSIIDIFLFTNVASCFLVTDLVNRVGLQKAVQGAACLMAVGCWLRSGLGFLSVAAASAATEPTAATSLMTSVLNQPWLQSLLPSSDLVSYGVMVVGTILVGAAQPFFQCTPPLLSAKWFAEDERATSTAVALNFNQIGIATAFLVGGAMATTTSGMELYFGLISLLATLTAFGTLVQFENEPPVPPSLSEWEKQGEVEPPFLESVQTFFQTPGFTRPLLAFICSISVTNIVGAFIDEIMVRGGVTNQLGIDLAGAGFEFAILLGGILIGGFVDKTKEYKNVTLACLLATLALVVPLGLDSATPLVLVLSLLGLGMVAGPVQPINAELAVDVTYPGDETGVESVQQIGGNLISALLLPVVERAAHMDPLTVESISLRGDVVVLMAICAGTIAYFSGFDAPLKRTQADGATNGETSLQANGDQAILGPSETLVESEVSSREPVSMVERNSTLT